MRSGVADAALQNKAESNGRSQARANDNATVITFINVQPDSMDSMPQLSEIVQKACTGYDDKMTANEPRGTYVVYSR